MQDIECEDENILFEKYEFESQKFDNKVQKKSMKKFV